MLKKYLCFCVLMCLSLFASAQTLPTIDLQLTWTAPGFRENGAVLAPAEIANYEIKYRKGGDGPFTTVKVAGSTTAYSIKAVPKGVYEVLIATVDTNGLYSASVPIIYISPNPPNPPSNVKISLVSAAILSTSK